MSSEPKELILRLKPDVVIPTPEPETIAALLEIAEQLAWRGPTGKVMGHVVLKRSDAEALNRDLERLRNLRSK